MLLNHIAHDPLHNDDCYISLFIFELFINIITPQILLDSDGRVEVEKS
jgi:hypothetical protein